jgi:hypothetical protein
MMLFDTTMVLLDDVIRYLFRRISIVVRRSVLSVSSAARLVPRLSTAWPRARRSVRLPSRSSGLIASGTQQEIDSVARHADGAAQVFLLAIALDIGLVHAPAVDDRARVSPNAFSNKGTSFITQRCTLE